MLYATNAIGAIANMIHPLSAEKEIELYLQMSESVVVVTLDQFYNKFEAIRENTKIVNIIIARIKDELSKPIKTGYMLTEGRKITPIPKDAPVIQWDQFSKLGKACSWNYKVKRKAQDPAVILYSGGTTGKTKGIVLSNINFNALSQQVIAANPMFKPGDKMLGPRSMHTHNALTGRQMYTGAKIYSQKLRQTDNQIQMQFHSGSSYSLRGSASHTVNGKGRFILSQGSILRRRFAFC